ncbi:hypothetical protein PLESTF_001212600 [Pleodorina starrii]|nr:hypothetical protein PLESTF_001212600 [Pleodorina starrii]
MNDCTTRPRANINAASASAATSTSPSASPPPPPPPPQPPADLLLSDIRVILVAPKHEANIGAVARACANFECLSLYLVAPRCGGGGGADGGGGFDAGGEARKVACGDAVLDRVVVTSSLAEALADTVGSIGFTRRAGATRLTHASLGHLLAEFPWALPLQPPSPLPPQPPPPSPPLLESSVPPLPQAAAAAAAAVSDEAGSGPGSASPLGNDWPCDEEPSAVERGPGLEGGLGRPGGPPSGLTDADPGKAEGGGSEGRSGQEGRRPCYAIALVFGREESGLTEAELRLCSHACAIPTGRLQPSMNLSHAVATVLAELFSRRCGLLDIAPTPAAAAAVQRAAAAVDADGGTRLLQVPPTAAAAAAAAACCSATAAGARSGGDGGGSDGESDVTGRAARSDASTSSSTSTSTTSSTIVTARGGAVLAAAAAAGPAGGAGGSWQAPGDAGLLPASAQEVDLLVRKVAAAAEAVGMSGEESSGGGNAGNHGRRRLPIGHLRAVVSRARLSAAESRSLHGLASAVLQRLDPDHPLEARKQQRRKQRQQQQTRQEQQQAGQEQQQSDEQQQQQQQAEEQLAGQAGQQ